MSESHKPYLTCTAVAAEPFLPAGLKLEVKKSTTPKVLSAADTMPMVSMYEVAILYCGERLKIGRIKETCGSQAARNMLNSIFMLVYRLICTTCSSAQREQDAQLNFQLSQVHCLHKEEGLNHGRRMHSSFMLHASCRTRCRRRSIEMVSFHCLRGVLIVEHNANEHTTGTAAEAERPCVAHVVLADAWSFIRPRI